MSKPSAPPPPDYAALATQQGAANKETAVFNSNSNRANQVGPDGSLTWSRNPSSPTGAADDGTGWTQTVALSPDQQKLHDMQMAISQKAGTAAEGAIDRATSSLATPIDTSKMPGISYGPQAERVNGINVETALSPLIADPQRAAAAQAQAGQGTAAQAQATGSINSTIDRSGVRALPGSIDDTSRRRVEEALMSRLNPSLQLDENHLRNRLLNSGIEVGTDAYNREMTLSGQKMTDARMQAILAGGQEESRQVGLTQGLQRQEFEQAQAQAAARQAAESQMYATQNSIAQQNANALTSTSNANAGLSTQASVTNANNTTNVSQQNAAMEAQRRQALIDTALRTQQQNIGAAQQNFNQGLASSTMNNQARSQELAETYASRLQPLNEVNAMRSGAQVTNPTFGGYYQGTAQAAPVFDAGVAQGNYDMSAYQSQISGNNALWGGLAGLGGAALKTFKPF